MATGSPPAAGGDEPSVDIGGDRLGGAGDDLYAALMAAHDGLTEADSAMLNARLILILMNQIGDATTIRAAIEAARRTAPDAATRGRR